MEQIEYLSEDWYRKRRTAKSLMWVGILSIIMLFAGLTSAYIVRQAEGQWLYFDIPSTFYISTAILVLCSLTLVLMLRQAKSGNQKMVGNLLLLTLGLGLAFSFTQFQAWGELVDAGIFFTGGESNASGSFLYVITGAHLAHLGGGLIALIFTWIKNALDRYSPENTLGLELTAMYWHFLDLLWIYLLLFLVYIR
jgi:cytochrome c oxidase subunit 3